MSAKQRINCEICHGDLSAANFAKSYITLSQCGSFKVTDKDYGICLPMVKCVQCGLVQTRDLMSAEEVLKLYNTVDDEYLKTAEARGYSNFLQITKILGFRLADIHSVFEIGAGSGILLKNFKTIGKEVAGLEPNNFFCEFAKKFGIVLQNNSIDQAAVSNQYDLVVAVDVIEHSISLDSFMKKASSLLNAGGFLVIVTPNRESLVARLLGKRWWHIRPPHLYYLSSKNAIDLAQRKNLKLVKKGQFAWRHTVGYILNCLQSLIFKRILINFTWFKIPIYLNTFDSAILLFQK